MRRAWYCARSNACAAPIAGMSNGVIWKCSPTTRDSCLVRSAGGGAPGRRPMPWPHSGERVGRSLGCGSSGAVGRRRHCSNPLSPLPAWRPSSTCPHRIWTRLGRKYGHWHTAMACSGLALEQGLSGGERHRSPASRLAHSLTAKSRPTLIAAGGSAGQQRTAAQKVTAHSHPRPLSPPCATHTHTHLQREHGRCDPNNPNSCKDHAMMPGLVRSMLLAAGYLFVGVPEGEMKR